MGLWKIQTCMCDADKRTQQTGPRTFRLAVVRPLACQALSLLPLVVWFSNISQLSRLLLCAHGPTGKILQSQCSSTYLSIDTPTSHSTYCNLTKLMEFISHPCRPENNGETFVLSMHRENCITNDTTIYTLD